MQYAGEQTMPAKAITPEQRANVIDAVPRLIELREHRDKILKESEEARIARRKSRVEGQKFASGEVKEIAERIGVSTATLTKFTNFAIFHSYEHLVEKQGYVRTGPISLQEMCNIVEFAYCTQLLQPYIDALFSKIISTLQRHLLFRKDVGNQLIESASVSDFIPNENNVVEAYPSWNVQLIDKLVRQKTGKSLRQVLIEHEATLRDDSVVRRYESVQSIEDLDKYSSYRKTLDDYEKIAAIAEDFTAPKEKKLTQEALATKLDVNRDQVGESQRFMKLHGVDEYKSLNGTVYSGHFSELEISNILDFMDAFHLPQTVVATVFKIHRKIITRAVRNRKVNGSTYPCFIANVPESTNIAVLKEIISKYNKNVDCHDLVKAFYLKKGLTKEQAYKQAYLTYKAELGLDISRIDVTSLSLIHMPEEWQFGLGSKEGNPFHCGFINFESKRLDPCYRFYDSRENPTKVDSIAPRVVGRAKRLNCHKPKQRKYSYYQRERISYAEEQRLLFERWGETPKEASLIEESYGFYDLQFGSAFSILEPVVNTTKLVEVAMDDYVLDNPCMIIETANELGNQCNIAGLNAVSNSILASIDANLNSTYCTNYGKKIMLFTDSLQDIQLALMHPEYTCSLAMAIPVSSCYSDKALDLTVAESMFNDEVCDITKVINRPNLEKIIGCKSTYKTRRQSNRHSIVQAALNSESSSDSLTESIGITSGSQDIHYDSANKNDAEKTQGLDQAQAQLEMLSMAAIQSANDEDSFDENLDQADVSDIIAASKRIDSNFVDPEDPSGMRDMFLEECGYDIGMPAKAYKEKYANSSNPGRKPIVNPFSEGFNELDEKTKWRSINSMLNMLKTAMITKKKIKKLGPIYDYEYVADVEARKVQLYHEIVATMPKGCMKTVVAHVMGLSSVKIQYHTKIRNRDATERYINAARLDHLVKTLAAERPDGFGIEYVTSYLDFNAGFVHCRQTIARSMKRTGCVYVKKYHTNSTVNTFTGENQYVVPNRTNNVFVTARPLQRVDSDLMFVRCKDGILVIHSTMDAFNCEIICSTTASTPCQKMVSDHQDLILKLLPEGALLISHTDRGAHYMNKSYAMKYDLSGKVLRSMSGKGMSTQNGNIESFHAKVREEVVARIPKNERTRARVAEEFMKWLHFYNNKRPNTRCYGLSPIVYRNIFEKYHQDPLFVIRHNDLNANYEFNLAA